MRTLILTLLVVAGCGSVSMPDLGGNNNDLNSSVQDMTQAPTGDAALLALGAKCTSNAQCGSKMCEPYMMGNEMLCTLPCTAHMTAPNCPSGQCNGMGFCQFPGMN
jgi:hypothetical protein